MGSDDFIKNSLALGPGRKLNICVKKVAATQFNTQVIDKIQREL